jgi:hypothetical protein
VPVADKLSEVDGESEPESEPVEEGLAPAVNEAVGVRDADFERLTVIDGVDDGVLVGVIVGIGDGVALAVGELETLAVVEIDGDTEGLSPYESVLVAELESDALRVAVEDVVGNDVVVDEGVDELVGVPDAETDAVALPVSVALEVMDGVLAGDGELLAVAPSDRVVVGVPDIEADRLTVVERLSLPVAV